MASDQFKHIQNPEDLRKLLPEDLKVFARELRQEIIYIIAKGEGHLGSSLGTVELTIALHYCFNTPKDLIIWDVGHQAYGHKMITGRRKAFQKLRQRNGISGFPKRDESPYDTFGTGHAGTAISAALGMALSAKTKDQNRLHIAVVGDASIANGMAFEALNHLGTTQANVLVILNDNSMGIDPSVGALKKFFNTVKKETPSTLNFFQSLNLSYQGPINGHNIEVLLSTLENQKKQKGPRILHVITTKGKGLPLAEEKQIIYHAPGKFDPLTGKLNPLKGNKKLKFQTIFGETLLNLALINKSIVAITPAMPTGSGLVKMLETLPKQCIDVGIAEQHAVTLAAGMASQGMLPFCVIYSTFLQRAYDQIIHDVAIQKLPIIFCIDRAGIVGHDGPTHHGLFDISFLRCIPNIQIVAPRDSQELQNILYTAQLGINLPLAIRYPRGYSEQKSLSFDFKKISWGKGTLLKNGSHIAILSLGTISKNIEKALSYVNYPEAFAHFDLCFAKPLDEELLHKVFNKFKTVVVFEEGVKQGGVGSAVLEFASQKMYQVPVHLEGVSDIFIPHGDTDELFQEIGLDVNGITKKLQSLLNKVLE
ncbi:1-deoxy-D-xylulose-5-phosphate synthase [Flavobacteriaceae bacterium]|nr:1-deoxy-D-xylulose-5-phosphate synthase [Flavobacteriaceae bacterium]MDA9680598.1 1-deoxy-D-xylulose-5-phosphate synthase [Flavobacteriaceae bacterium]